jgi:phosphomevalonate kinase
MDHWVTNPVERFNDHIHRLGKLRDLIQTKLSTYTSRMFGLENLLNALISTKGMTDESELEISKESVTYWKDKFESRVAMLDKEVREENTEIMRWWSKVVATELAKIDEEIKVNITAAAAADKILELEQVLTSISSMREKLQEAVNVLREALQKVERPDSLLQLGIQKADMLDLSTEELPLTLRLQVEGWAGTRDKIYREKISTLVEAVGEINNIK